MADIWVLVADRAEARIFSCARLGQDLELLETHTNPQGRAHVGELISDTASRVHDSKGNARHSMAEAQDVKREDSVHFARELNKRLEQAQQQGKFAKLAVIAAPAMLGHLREVMHKPLAALLVAELDKDLVHADAGAIARALEQR